MSNQPQSPSPIARNVPATGSATTASASAAVPQTRTGQGHGDTTIADSVVAKIAGLAARNIPGVYALGGGAARALGSIRTLLDSETTTPIGGISVQICSIAATPEAPAARNPQRINQP